MQAIGYSMLPTPMSFEAYFEAIWQSRWPILRQALLQEKNYASMTTLTQHVTEPYYLDKASYEIVKVLGLLKGESVMDMCAAPGGKTLAMLETLGSDGQLWANDKERHARLHRVLGNYYPGHNFRVTGKDGRTLGLKTTERFDAVLLDAPCSSEWHWLQDAELLKHWRPTRAKRLAVDQYALLASALMLLKDNGRCLYLTCSINPLENECIIEKAIKRWGDKITVDTEVPAHAEPARVGFYFLPDVSVGGPLYGCLLRRVEPLHL